MARRASLTVRPLIVTAAILFGAFSLYAVAGVGRGSADRLFNVWVINGLLLSAPALLFAR